MASWRTVATPHWIGKPDSRQTERCLSPPRGGAPSTSAWATNLRDAFPAALSLAEPLKPSPRRAQPQPSSGRKSARRHNAARVPVVTFRSEQPCTLLCRCSPGALSAASATPDVIAAAGHRASSASGWRVDGRVAVEAKGGVSPRRPTGYHATLARYAAQADSHKVPVGTGYITRCTEFGFRTIHLCPQLSGNYLVTTCTLSPCPQAIG